MKETVECEFYLRVRGVKIGSVSEMRRWKGSGVEQSGVKCKIVRLVSARCGWGE